MCSRNTTANAYSFTLQRLADRELHYFDMEEIDFFAINLGHKPIEIKKGEAIAQMLITNVNTAQMQVINDAK